MRLICYPTSGEPPQLVPAAVERDWMERTDSGFAYRCLPLNIANAHGWLILNEAPFVAEWDGGTGLDAVVVQPTTGDANVLGSSHFGSGVLTFHVNGLFRTEPGWDLLVTGPFNRLKDAIQPLTGIVETDWSPFTFTMNWRFTRKFAPVSFERGEPFCMLFPVQRGIVEAIEPEFHALASDPEVAAAYAAWAESRRAFNEGLKIAGSPAQGEKWQRDYFRGSGRYGAPPDDHRTRLRVKPFTASDRS
jgi:hypothetical protein